MKKTRFLILALVVAVMLVGAGYAWWSESVQISSTVNTGYLDVDAQNPTAYTEFLSGNLLGKDIYLPDNNYSKAGIAFVPSTDSQNDDDSVTVTFSDMYPGSKGTAKFDIINNSTMGVKLVRFMNASALGTLEAVDVSISPKFKNEDANWPLDDDIRLDAVYTNGVLTGYKMPDIFDDVIFDKGEVLEVKITAIVSKDLDNSGEKGTLTLNLTPKFVQFNQF